MRLVIRFLKDESAATAIEYGLIAAGIAVAVIAVVQGLGTKLNHILKRLISAQITGPLAPGWPIEEHNAVQQIGSVLPMAGQEPDPRRYEPTPASRVIRYRTASLPCAQTCLVLRPSNL